MTTATIQGNIVTKYRNQKMSVVAACFIFMIGVLYFWSAPVAYIDVTVNPKVKFTLNRFQRIIAVEGLNEDGKNLINNISVIGHTVDDAYLNLLALLKQKGYLSKTDSIIRLDVSHDKTAQVKNLENLLTDLTADFLEEHQLHCEFHTHTAGTSRHKNNQHSECNDDLNKGEEHECGH